MQVKKIKTSKKRMNSGGDIGVVTQAHKSKVYYSSVVSKDRQELSMNKETAVSYFRKNNAFQRQHQISHMQMF